MKKMKMMKMMVVLILSCVLGVSADALHDEIYMTGCSDSDGENMYGLDGDEIYYADFKNKKAVYPQPDFVGFRFVEGIYQQAEANQQICKQNLDVARQAYKNPPPERDPPSSPMIYPRDYVELEVKNTLICHVTGFFPAPVKFSWTKNGQKVTEGTSVNVPFVNKDFTLNQFSKLDFTPQQGDIYSCSVTHPALKEPQTRIWDVEKTLPGVGPAVFCGLGLTVGLLGVAAGTFFLIKGNECR
ncbi:RLA class II histocompatibility antigen, DP alpha-1 chain-like [Acanthopagrus latus]|uniref:RLA class II histocompatibility antigen, DP alpha-1 chain-like n=1 Tax=Acanthopagrus latus TaxID=8177 RepID=UPI00187BDFA6|nr:RLA class II histocompatibility antigen, DP alpha-1 chain-like [Acanthopagrus latus]